RSCPTRPRRLFTRSKEVALGPKPRRSGWVTTKRRSAARGNGFSFSGVAVKVPPAVTVAPVQGSFWDRSRPSRSLRALPWWRSGGGRRRGQLLGPASCRHGREREAQGQGHATPHLHASIRVATGWGPVR